MKKVTTNKDGSPRKSGSGRRKGANSFINISLADLEKFCGSASVIPVSRVWLENLGAVVSEASKTSVASSPKKVEEEQKISFTIHQ